MANAFVYPGGLNLDTNGKSVTIAQALTAPTGYGVGTSLSTISVGKRRRVGLHRPAGGDVFRARRRRAGHGRGRDRRQWTVAGITITSPGSGYANGESVAVIFNAGDNTSGAASRPRRGSTPLPARGTSAAVF